jgi:23S rRNA (uracil1939-C5)-methyltransferase
MTMLFENIRCDRLADSGDGLVIAGNRRFIVKDMLPGEVADIEVDERGSGVVRRRIATSGARVSPRCPHYEICGGCSLQHMDYPAQLSFKTGRVEEVLRREGLKAEALIPCIGMKDPWNYRNKIQMAVTEKGKKILAGFYEENTRKIVNADACDIQDDRANAIVHTCKKLFMKHHIEPYREDKGTGLIRHVLVRVAAATGEILVVLVTTSEIFPGRNNVVTDLRAAHPEITTIVQNVNARQTPIVLGEFERVLYGKGYIEDILLARRFRIAAKTFYQINPRQAAVLYSKALEFAKPKPTDTVLDAYSGIGTLAIAFAGQAGKVLAVELNPASVKMAIQNAWINGVKNVFFRQGDASQYMEALKTEGIVPDIVVLDPPRQGLDPSFVKTLLLVKPSKIVYISCDPSTLARDLNRLVAEGYALKRVQPVDMFCQTAHVESVSLLTCGKDDEETRRSISSGGEVHGTENGPDSKSIHRIAR